MIEFLKNVIDFFKDQWKENRMSVILFIGVVVTILVPLLLFTAHVVL